MGLKEVSWFYSDFTQECYMGLLSVVDESKVAVLPPVR